MDEPNLFTINRDGAILIIALPKTALSFAEQVIQEQVQTILEHLKDPTVANLVIDFGQCPYFGSAILGAILRFYNAVQDRQGKCAACNLSKDGCEILRIAKFDTIWPVFDSREEALESVKR